jgi:hydrogenase maturation protease
VVVIGVGNAFRGDDGAGPEVVRLLRDRLPASVELLEHDGDPAGLLQAWDGAGLVYVVDAVRGGGPSGTVHRFEVGQDEVPADPRRSSSHALGLGDAVQLARVLERLPDRLVLLGVSGECFDTGAPLTDPVRRAVATVVDALAQEVGQAL